MLAKNKTIGRNRKGMKVEYEFYKKYKSLNLLPHIELWWSSEIYGLSASWLIWGIHAEFLRDNVCR